MTAPLDQCGLPQVFDSSQVLLCFFIRIWAGLWTLLRSNQFNGSCNNFGNVLDSNVLRKCSRMHLYILSLRCLRKLSVTLLVLRDPKPSFLDLTWISESFWDILAPRAFGTVWRAKFLEGPWHDSWRHSGEETLPSTYPCSSRSRWCTSINDLFACVADKLLSHCSQMIPEAFVYKSRI